MPLLFVHVVKSYRKIMHKSSLKLILCLFCLWYCFEKHLKFNGKCFSEANCLLTWKAEPFLDRESKFCYIFLFLKCNFSVIICPSPDVHTDTTFIDESDDSFPFGTQIEYKCLPGYQLFSSTKLITCTESGIWYPKPPICSGKLQKLIVTF